MRLFAVKQKIDYGCGEICRLHDGNSIAGPHGFHDLSEVLVGRSDQHGHPCLRGLKWIVAAGRNKAPSHECDRGEPVEAGQIANRVQQKDPSSMDRKAGTQERRRPQRHQSSLPQEQAHLVESFRVSWGEDEQGRRTGVQNLRPRVQNPGLLAF